MVHVLINEAVNGMVRGWYLIIKCDEYRELMDGGFYFCLWEDNWHAGLTPLSPLIGTHMGLMSDDYAKPISSQSTSGGYIQLANCSIIICVYTYTNILSSGPSSPIVYICGRVL